MHRCAVLLPIQLVQIAIVPDAQLWKDRVLEQAVVRGPSQGLVAIELQAKGPVAPKSTEHHQLGGKGGALINKMVRLPPVYRI